MSRSKSYHCSNSITIPSLTTSTTSSIEGQTTYQIGSGVNSWLRFQPLTYSLTHLLTQSLNH